MTTDELLEELRKFGLVDLSGASGFNWIALLKFENEIISAVDITPNKALLQLWDNVKNKALQHNEERK